MKKITLLFTCIIGSFGLMHAQTFQNSDVNTGDSTVYNTPIEERQQNVQLNGNENLAPVVITQSNTQNIEAGQGIACATHPIDFRDNNFYRDFDLPGDFGITNGFEVTAVEFAIDAISTPSGFPIYVNVYSTTPGSFPGGTLTLQGAEEYTATNADALSIVNVPLSAIIPAGEAMVVELVIIDDGMGVNYMTTGVNSDGETGPSYIMAPDCGATVPTPFFDLGLTVGMVWNVIGDDEPVIGIDENTLEGFDFYPNPTNDNLSLKSVNNIEAVSIYNLLGQNVLNSEIGATTADLDISNLNTGTYIMKVTVDGQTGSYKILKN